jgi:hypothetical protein
MDMGWEFELNFNVSVRKKKFTQIHFLSSHTYNNDTEQDLRKEGKIRGGKQISFDGCLAPLRSTVVDLNLLSNL